MNAYPQAKASSKMKGILSCVIAFLYLGFVSATQNTDSAIPLLRGYDGATQDHFYTTNAAEMENAITVLNYKSEGDAARIFVDHFYTTSIDERNNAVQNLGYNDEGIVGYIYPSAACCSVPFYRLYNPTVHDHFYTANANEKNTAAQTDGYVDEGIAGYVLSV
ncbi:uncharacterized protein EV420DRAFT_1645350 [Desarmillaria tabescens]|uniref:DUF5648 domain-containing protein n=1 Tax=Armillaria tabescens TaxID=1929756 RepID=A0AA39K696_ARMTA|nr:uncharacterized protein EV420DRAFT_1645350 [Desarmillaria tabescens]KAK0454121.1 hypothetical protein EV420DRAFT_1645350 [Desarmillaria tabescens]